MKTVSRTIYHIVATRKVYSIGIFSLYSLLFILEHRARTTSFHLFLSLAAPLPPPRSCWWSSIIQLVEFFSRSNMVFHSSVFPVGSSPRLGGWCLQVCSWRVHVVCPLHFLLWMVLVKGSCPVLCQSFFFEIRSGHLMFRIWQTGVDEGLQQFVV